MPSQRIIPCLWLDDQAEQAAAQYLRTFPGGGVTATSRYPEGPPSPGGRPGGSVLTVEVVLAGVRFTLLNGGPTFRPGPSISFFAHADTPAEADRLHAVLGEGGTPLMPLGEYPWSPRYAWVADRYGVSWQIITGRRPPGAAAIVPCLMFSGPQHGRAEEAMRAYAAAIPESRIVEVARYASGEGPEAWVKHGRLVLAGQPLVAMDSHLAHDVTFDEGVSLQVMCRDQAEVDRCWAALGEGGTPVQCGWLKDRFGLSWQVVPEGLVDLITGPDTAARGRVFAALMQMVKLDLAALRRAATGP